ncbi:hypothetical protein ABES23_06175 [Peribacillus frigoritolerans]|uniref:hypothetical protein n=1 Tax=Peribacillus frigoritolerans TaxID=450367 RepID=UPI003D2DF6CD
MKQYLKDHLLVRSIVAHKKIVSEGEAVNLVSIGYEEGTPLERVHQYNAFTIMTKLQFPKDEVLNISSKSRQYLDELAEKNLSVEETLQLLIDYRDRFANS